ncbi:MAG: 50S ribosomal protein L25 [Bacteroidales bacterium]|nr:50S ribosomal protein L25 [Bacteroidales bacterium]
MKTFALNATPRTDLGKKATKALRAESKIPAVVNGGEVVTLPYEGALKEGQKIVEIAENKTSNVKKAIIVTDITVDKEAVRKLIYTPEIFVVDLTVNGEVKKVVLKDLQFHPVTDEILHIDFLEVSENKPVVMEVPVALEGHAEGVKAGGKLSLSMKKLKVKAVYSAIPERIVVNIDNIQLGQSLKVGSLHYEGLELMNSKNAVVCAVQLTRAARGQQANQG